MAKLLRELGETPVVLSRGYGGKLRGPVRVDPVRHAASDVGDEPLMLAGVLPVVVSREWVAAVRETMGELPSDIASRLTADHGLSAIDARRRRPADALALCNLIQKKNWVHPQSRAGTRSRDRRRRNLCTVDTSKRRRRWA